MVKSILKTPTLKISSSCQAWVRARKPPKNPIRIRGDAGERPTPKVTVTDQQLTEAMEPFKGNDPDGQLAELVRVARLSCEDIATREEICRQLAKTVARRKGAAWKAMYAARHRLEG